MVGSPGQRKSRGWLIGALAALSVCVLYLWSDWWEIDPPERGIMAEADLPISVDTDCVERALRKQFPNLNTYAGWAGDVPDGKFQSILDYYSSADGKGRATLTFIDLGSSTKVEHLFLGHGYKLPQQDFPPAMQAMERASDSLRSDCNVDLSVLKFREIGQRVDALH
jgi:hypothetical protein